MKCITACLVMMLASIALAEDVKVTSLTGDWKITKTGGSTVAISGDKPRAGNASLKVTLSGMGYLGYQPEQPLGTLGSLDAMSFDYMITQGQPRTSGAYALRVETSDGKQAWLSWEFAPNNMDNRNTVTKNQWHSVNVSSAKLWMHYDGTSFYPAKPLSFWKSGGTVNHNGKTSLKLGANTKIIAVSVGGSQTAAHTLYIDKVCFSFSGGVSKTFNFEQ